MKPQPKRRKLKVEICDGDWIPSEQFRLDEIFGYWNVKGVKTKATNSKPIKAKTNF